MLDQIEKKILASPKGCVEANLIREGYQRTKCLVYSVDHVGVWVGGSPGTTQRTAVPWTKIQDLTFL